MINQHQLDEDERYMRRALALACNGLGWVNPNPMVGAVVVKNGHIIGEGWHTQCGALHAEREALAHCSEDPEGSTVYVTLEPCCHWGKTPPCTDTLIENKVSRVVIGAPDPNPLVAGKGVTLLRKAHIAVSEGVLLRECLDANRVFFHYIQTKLPYVVLKYAMTLDGKTATRTGASQWITGSVARAHVHVQRHRFSAIMVGIATVLADNPELTSRLSACGNYLTSWKTDSAFMKDPHPGLAHANNPIRIVVDSSLRVPLQSNLVATAKEIPTLIATVSTDEKRIKALENQGCEVLVVDDDQGKVNLKSLLVALGNKGIDSVYAEGGATLHGTLIEEKLAQEVHAYIAPKLFGGASAPGPVGGSGVDFPDSALITNVKHIDCLGDDIFFECEVN